MIGSDDLTRALRDKASVLHADLIAEVEDALFGGVLQTHSGTLKASVIAELTADEDGVRASVGSAGVPYAAIQEYGGTTPPHLIEPVKAKALAFAGGFFARVHHPGSRIPARAPFGSALDAMRDEIAGSIKDAVRGALDAN